MVRTNLSKGFMGREVSNGPVVVEFMRRGDFSVKCHIVSHNRKSTCLLGKILNRTYNFNYK